MYYYLFFHILQLQSSVSSGFQSMHWRQLIWRPHRWWQQRTEDPWRSLVITIWGSEDTQSTGAKEGYMSCAPLWWKRPSSGRVTEAPFQMTGMRESSLWRWLLWTKAMITCTGVSSPDMEGTSTLASGSTSPTQVLLHSDLILTNRLSTENTTFLTPQTCCCYFTSDFLCRI